MAKVAAKAAVQAARILLNVAEDIPYFGTVAMLMNQLIQICDQCKCNKEASQVLQERFCRLTEHLFSGSQGLAAIATCRPNNMSLAVFCGRMESILQNGISELERFTKGGFIMSILKGSKPQSAFENLDNDMTQCLNELSVALHVTALNEQAQIYDVVCNIQAKVDGCGGPEGLMANPALLASFAKEIGADVNDLRTEVVLWLASLSTQVNVVDENVRDMKAKVDAVHKAVVMMQKTTASPDLSSLSLSSHPLVDRSQVLGEGAFGKVYKGICNHIEVAVKVVSPGAAVDKEFLREVAMHHKVGKLPGVVRIFGANFPTVPRYIVLELAAGTLHDALHKDRPQIDRTLSSKLSILAQVCSTMAAISDMGILHRDLKSSNVLLFFNNNCVYAKISDFGLTKMANESTIGDAGATPKGTLPYMAPELFRGDYSSASDMYAFAVLLNEVLTEKVPFPGRSYVEIVQAVGTYRHRPDRYKADVMDALGCELMCLTESCWHQDPALRMSFQELAAELNHLLRKAAEAARVGNQASVLTPPRPPTREIEASITMLSDWLASSCHLAETDALPLAHTLVTVKHVTSVQLLSQVLQRSPDFFVKEVKISPIHEINIITALGINTKPSSTSSVKLGSLSSDELCQLFRHCKLSQYSGIIEHNKLTGFHLQDSIDSVQDLVDLGLDKMTARGLFRRIADWKTEGLPDDFKPTQVTAALSKPFVDLFSASSTTTISNTPISSNNPAVDLSASLIDLDFVSAGFNPTQSPTPVPSSFPAFTSSDLFPTQSLGFTSTYADFHPTQASIHTATNFTSADFFPTQSPAPVFDNFASADFYPTQSSAPAFSAFNHDPFSPNNTHTTAKGPAMQQTKQRTTVSVSDKQLDDDFTTARFLRNRAATDRIIAAAGASNHLAEAYLGILYDCEDTLIGKNGAKAVEYAEKSLAWMRQNATNGNMYALFNLAMCYYDGRCVAKDTMEAVRYFKLAATQGHTGAQNSLGVCYKYGTGVPKDGKEAVRYYTLAADQGHADAQNNLGLCYEYGPGGTQDKREAARYYKLAADQGLAAAQFNIGLCYEYGTGLAKNEQEAVRFYTLAADQGHAEAQCSLGVCYLVGTCVTIDLLEAARYFNLAADQGRADAQFHLGVRYMYGSGVTQDKREAVRYYILAADQGNADAQFNIGLCYNYGTGVAKNEQEAVRYYTLAADQGHAEAQCNLGAYYLNGTVVTLDLIEAARYFKLAADQGLAAAQFNLGLCYEYGTAVTIDLIEATRYFKLAADQGHAEAIAKYAFLSAKSAKVRPPTGPKVEKSFFSFLHRK